MLSVDQARNEAQLQMAEKAGADFRTIFELTKKSVDMKRVELQLANEELANLQAQGFGLESDQVQQAVKKVFSLQADVVTKTMGLQRDFLDKALGRAFGTPSGSRFQPVLLYFLYA